jgi:biotin synthase
MKFSDIIRKNTLTREDLTAMLSANADESKELFAYANKVKQKHVGNKVYFRGLIEFSNVCSKDCYYCGIRKSNKKVQRYNLTDEQIIEAATFAHENNYGSVVMQGGELESSAFTQRIESLLKNIKKLSNNTLGITLSLGEQSDKTYQRWKDAGAHRYLLRIESSNKELYCKIHPKNELHKYERRLNCLYSLKSIGYQTGTGVMIGLPFQSIDHLADDLLFMKSFDVDMVGMGPYIEHMDTPLYQHKDALLAITERFDLSLKMIATLRILMQDINIAAATALQAIDPLGREKAVKVGANIIMPNITPGKYRNDYSLYENKPCADEEPDQCKNCLDVRIQLADGEIAYGKWGDSLHFLNRQGIPPKKIRSKML